MLETFLNRGIFDFSFILSCPLWNTVYEYVSLLKLSKNLGIFAQMGFCVLSKVIYSKEKQRNRKKHNRTFQMNNFRSSLVQITLLRLGFNVRKVLLAKVKLV
jgi:hypothetical protein